jgi:hypothetical protein
MKKYESIAKPYMATPVSLLLVLCLTSFVAAQLKPAANANFTSVYTDIKHDCKALPQPKGTETGSDPETVCKAVGEYRIAIGYSAWGASLAAESLKNRNKATVLGTDYGGYGAKGEKIEWRLANNKPFAVIMRISKYKETNDGGNPVAEENRTGSRLVIKGLKGWEHINFEVDGATPNANLKARQMADQNYFKNK